MDRQTFLFYLNIFLLVITPSLFLFTAMKHLQTTYVPPATMSSFSSSTTTTTATTEPPYPPLPPFSTTPAFPFLPRPPPFSTSTDDGPASSFPPPPPRYSSSFSSEPLWDRVLDDPGLAFLFTPIWNTEIPAGPVIVVFFTLLQFIPVFVHLRHTQLVGRLFDVYLVEVQPISNFFRVFFQAFGSLSVTQSPYLLCATIMLQLYFISFAVIFSFPMGCLTMMDYVATGVGLAALQILFIEGRPFHAFCVSIPYFWAVYIWHNLGVIVNKRRRLLYVDG